MRVAPSGISGNNAWGMAPSSWCVPGDLDNHGRYHFYFPAPILVCSDTELPNLIPASAYVSRPPNYSDRKSGGLSLLLQSPRLSVSSSIGFDEDSALFGWLFFMSQSSSLFVDCRHHGGL